MKHLGGMAFKALRVSESLSTISVRTAISLQNSMGTFFQFGGLMVR